MPSRKSFTIAVQVTGMRETLAALRALGPDADKAIREHAGLLATKLRGSIDRAAKGARSPQARLVVQTLKIKKDRLPVLEVGGTKRLGRNKAPAWTLLFGAELGSNQHRQFHQKHTGRVGTWFFPTVEREQAEIVREWEEAADDVISSFGGGR